MQRAQLLALTSAIQAIRNDWDRNGIISQLTKLNDAWTDTDTQLALHAMTVAANPNANTPGALNALPTTKTAPATIPGAKEPLCFICGNTKTKCETLYDFETRHGLPDPHKYESAEEAENNSSRATAQRKLEAIAALAKSKSIPA